jgi:hypothetical protein
VVPILEGKARMKPARECPLCFRGPIAAALRVMPSGVQAVTNRASSGLGAGCVKRFRRGDHKVPRSRSSAGRQRCGLARPVLGSGSSVWRGGSCRCRSGLAARSQHSSRLATFRTNPTASPGLYGSASSAYGRPIMRQPNYALQRTVMRQRNLRRHRAAAERER